MEWSPRGYPTQGCPQHCSCCEVLLSAQARLADLADRHRREQRSVFEEVLASLASAASAEVVPASPTCSAASPPCDKLTGTWSPRPRRSSDGDHGRVACVVADTTVAATPTVATSCASTSGFPLGVFGLAPQERGGFSRKLGDICSQVDDSPGYAWCRKLLGPLLRLHAWLGELEEPERSGCLATWVDSTLFSTICVACIGLNAAFIIHTTDFEIQHRDRELPEMALGIEMAFMAFYVVELTLKLFVHRLFFFVCPDAAWNILDLLLVGMATTELAFLQGPSGMNMSFMRSLRFFRLAKVLRMFRTVRFFKEMRLMLDCVLGSLISLGWCFVMVTFVVYMFAVMIVQGLTQELQGGDRSWTPEQEQAFLSSFGSVGCAMLTLIMATTGGQDWGETFSLLRQVGGFVPWAFLAYIAFFVLAAWNIVTSLFVEKALDLAEPDLETKALELSSRDVADAQELTKIFSEFDFEHSGTLSLNELRSLVDHPKFRNYLRVRGIEIEDVDLFHRMLASVAADDSDELSIQLIVGACLRLRGDASSLCLHALCYEQKLTHRWQREYIRDCRERLGRVEEQLTELFFS